MKTSEIPRYDKGLITYWTDAETQSFNEGHSVTWGDPLVRTLLGIPNLIPYNYVQDRTIDKQLNEAQGGTFYKTFTVTTANGIVFTKKPYDEKTGTTEVDVTVPRWGTYAVTLKHGSDSAIQIIQKITYERGPADRPSGSITILDLDNRWFERKTSEIPAYHKGKFDYFEQGSVDSHNRGSGVSWSDPLVQGMLGISNLIPFNYLADEANAIGKQLSEGKETVTTSQGIMFTMKTDRNERPAIMEAKVPNWGTYTVTLNSGTDSGIAIIQKIVFEAE